MLIGLYARKNWKIGEKKLGQVLSILFLSGSVLLFLLIRVLEKKMGLYEIEFLLPVTYLMFAVSAFSLFIEQEERVKKVTKSRFGWIIGKISASSIEAYYVQFFIIDTCKTLPFPCNLLLIVIGICVVAVFCHKVSATLIDALYTKLG